MHHDDTLRILSFAGHLDSADRDGASSARARDWIDDAGNPTTEGKLLLRALADQGATRTVFRGL